MMQQLRNYDVPFTPISKNLLSIRQQFKHTRKMFAPLMHTNISSLRAWETGTRYPNFEILLELSLLTELSLDELLGFKPFDVSTVKFNDKIDMMYYNSLHLICKRKFAYNLYALRLYSDLSRPKLAKLLDVHTETIYHWENGTNIPHADKLIKIATYFNISIEQLVGLEKINL